MPQSIVEEYENLKCFHIRAGEYCSSSMPSIETLIDNGIIEMKDGITEMCKLIVPTKSWCGDMAGWGAGRDQEYNCNAIRKNIFHHQPTDTLFMCKYDEPTGLSKGGCKADEVPQTLLPLAHECHKARQ